MRLTVIVLCLLLTLRASAAAQEPVAPPAPPTVPGAPTPAPAAPALTDAEQAAFAAALSLVSMANHAGADTKEWAKLVEARQRLEAAQKAYAAELQRLPAWRAYADQRKQLDARLRARGLSLDWTSGALRALPAGAK